MKTASAIVLLLLVTLLVTWLSLRASNGEAERFVLRNAGGARARIEIELWNASPRPRAYSLEGSGKAVRGTLAADEKKVDADNTGKNQRDRAAESSGLVICGR